jgi:hypothetical protein
MQALILLCLTALVVAWQPPVSAPIPSYNMSLHITNPDPKSVQFELFVDLACDDSAAFWTTTLQQLLKQPLISSVSITAHLFPLPYHISAYELTKAFLLMDTEKLKYELADKIYNNQSSISNDRLANVAQKDFAGIIFDNYIKFADPQLTRENYDKAMQSNELKVISRVPFKYATTKGVFGTPTFFVNDVQIYNGNQFSSDDWIRLFKNKSA